ncbi:MAG: poly-beta-1,6 N-acetyl-D-glucosamine export porin PgaA, partial [Gammaproteobacteria bacterium]
MPRLLPDTTSGLRAASKHHLPGIWRLTRRLLDITVLCLILAALWQPAMAANGSDEARYQQALAQARAGQHAPALATLKDLLDQHPTHLPYLYDYLTVLGWAERDTQALALLPRLDIAHAPRYVLESLAKSARNLRRYQTAAEIYREVLRRQPQRLAAAIGLVLTLADMGHFAEAQATLAPLAARQPGHLDILATQAYVMEGGGDYFAALQIYEQMLRLSPHSPTARRGRILVSARLGAPHLAAALARSEPGLLSPAELEAISSDRTAITIRWGRLPHGDPATRFEETDQAITELKTRLQALTVAGRADSPRALQSRFDLMAAYLDRQRMNDVITVYETLPETARPLPPYVLNTAANAYLQLQQPERARDLLREALALQPDDFDSRLALVYALVESESFPEALTLVDQLSAGQPAWLGQGPPAYRKENPRRLEADSSAALVRAFADHLGEAQRRLENLSGQAPHNAALRAQKAYVYLWRGWPRHALEDFHIALSINPRQLDAQTGSSQALLELADYRQGQTILRGLQQTFPKQAEVAALTRRWDIHKMRQLRNETGYSDSSGNAEGGENFDFDAWLYDRPRRYRYRGFLHSHLSSAKFPEGRADYRRLGAGIEYRRPELELVSELSRDLDDSINAGLSLHGLWQPDDHWRLGAGYDSYSDNIPLRGRLNEDLDGWGVNFDVGYYFHESRRLDTSIQYLDFSDGNRRRSAQASLFQRVVSEPHYKLDGSAVLYTSRNDRDNAPYFNPGRDLSLDVTLLNEWLQYRRYEHSFRHRLAITAGLYEQQGFGSGATWQLRYEQQWNPGDRLELLYG